MEIIVSLLTLTFFEIVLGIDNLVFIMIVVDRLPKSMQAWTRNLGLFLAIFTRSLLLFSLSFLLGLQAPLFTLFSETFSIRDLILLAGGLFLIAKSTTEIHHQIEGEASDAPKRSQHHLFWQVILQIVLLDIIFSLDSVITAVGMANELWIMITAIVIAIFVMMAFVNKLHQFVTNHPTIKTLVLSLLLLVGFSLIGEAFHLHIPKGYIYVAVFFSLFVEAINLRVRKHS